MNGSKRSNWKLVNNEVIQMYQIYGLLTIMALLWGVTIWASISEEEKDTRS
ncbi:MAG: hypothetical protein OJF50_002722 [Nitrospira sp.]|jgi:hypothetical protein|nr:hypothetical protein [Nitrospira sp.]